MLSAAGRCADIVQVLPRVAGGGAARGRDRGPEQLERVPLDAIAYVQFSGALSPASGDMTKETTTRRTMPGDGIFDLARFAGTLLGRDWDGVVSTEVLSDDLRVLNCATWPSALIVSHDCLTNLLV